MNNEVGKKILDSLIELQRAYASTYRGMTTEERHRNLISSGLITNYDYDSEFIREPLIEHTGHLPVIASYLWQYAEHKSDINLGRALIMLSIHDIGEIEVGDKVTFHKNQKDNDDEYEVVKKRLPEELLKYFDEFEARETTDAKFAKMVDSLAPELHELALPEVTKERFEHFKFNTQSIIDKKEKYFTWDENFKELFDAMIQRYHDTIDN